MPDRHTIQLQARIGGSGEWAAVPGYRADVEARGDAAQARHDAEREARSVWRQFVAHLRAPGGRVVWRLRSSSGAVYRRACAEVGSIPRETTPCTLPALVAHVENCERLAAREPVDNSGS